MSDSPVDISSKYPPDAVLNQLKAIAGEHFNDFLIVGTKDGNVYTTYNAKISAFGMASMVCQDINHDWWVNRSNKI